ncbi:MAG: hypothetical protein C0599_04685, partial [Salinivirgaceae bacterium]
HWISLNRKYLNLSKMIVENNIQKISLLSVVKKILHLALLTAIFINFNSCSDITDLNEDPNQSQEVNPELLFKYAVKRGMGNYITQSHLEYNGIQQWMMYMGTRGGVENGNEYVQPSTAESFWNESYIDAMNNAQKVIDITATDINLQNKKAAALVWKTFIISRITDLWGAVPYSQALQGNPELEFTPEYDTQKEIYEKMMADLQSAIQLFDPNKPFFSNENDLIYGGDINMWISFANSLRLRFAVRIQHIYPELASTAFEDISNYPLIESNSSNATFLYNTVFNKPLYEAGSIRYEEGSSYINPSKFLVDLLIDSNDPRTQFYFEKTQLSEIFPFLDEYRGVPNLLSYSSEEWENYNLDAQLGDPNGEWGDVSRIGNWFMNNDRPFPILTCSEVAFLKAEASLSGNWAGNTKNLFEEGVTNHIDYINQYAFDEEPITQIELNNYLNQFSTISLADIITQKYVLFAFENVFEAYNDYRRTGFPILVDFYGDPINQDNFPQRLVYPFTEYTYNRGNYLNAIALQGPDELTTRFWWNTNGAKR